MRFLFSLIFLVSIQVVSADPLLPEYSGPPLLRVMEDSVDYYSMYVAFDDRPSPKPLWLVMNYVKTNAMIETTDVPLRLWRGFFEEGEEVHFPGAALGVDASNYVVLFSRKIGVVKPAGQELSPLGVGDTYYLDRSYIIVSIPPVAVGKWWLKTNNSDKGNDSNDYLVVK